MHLIVLFLTCADKDEAQRIADALLAQKLVACAKMMPVNSLFVWQGAIDKADEILLVMETKQELCSTIEKIVREHHSYNTFVLTGIPVVYISQQAQQWLGEVL